MKNILRYLCALIVVMCALPAMGQGLQIVYLKNGESIRHHITIADRTYNSRYDKENRAHASYVTYRIVLKDGYEHIYNIEDIDSIVFRSTTDESLNTAPTTDEELRESDALSIQIANSIENVHEEFEYKGNESIDDLVSAVQRISGVNSVMPNETNSSLLVEQEDGTSFAYLLNSTPDERPDYNFDKISNLLTSHVRQKAASTSGNKVVSVPKRGLILAPFQYEFNDDLELFAADIEQITGTKPKVFINAEADISKFNGDYLSQYDFIYISTHGAVLQHNMISLQTDFYTVTGTKWDKKTAEQYEARYNCRCKKLVKNGSNYIGISSNAFASYALRDKIVIVDACESMHKTGLSGTPLKDVMQANGTAFYFGNTAAVNPYMTNMYYSYFFATLCASTSIQEAAKWNSDPYFTEFWSKLSKAKKAHKEKESMPSLITYVSKDPLEPYYLKSPIPYDIETEPTNNDLSITWKSNQTSFEMDVYILNNEAEAVDIHTDEYTLKYDVYVDGTCRVKGTEENKLVLENVNSGSHEIYVVSQLFKNGFIIDTQRSEIRRISLSQPITSIAFTRPEVGLGVGQDIQLKYTVEPSNATDVQLKWRSNDESVARVDDQGHVYALKEGITQIRVATADDQVFAFCTIQVVDDFRLEIRNKTINVAAEGGDVTLDFDCNIPYSLISNDSWIKIGAFGRVTVDRNDGGEERTGTITIKNDAFFINETFTLIQAAAPYIRINNIQGNECAITPQGGDVRLDVQSNVDYELSTTTDWIGIENPHVGILTISPNPYSHRRGSFTIFNQQYGISQTYSVIQYGEGYNFVQLLEPLVYSKSVVLNASHPDCSDTRLRGFVYWKKDGTSPQYTCDCGNDVSNFSAGIMGLDAGTTYCYKAFCIHGAYRLESPVGEFTTTVESTTTRELVASSNQGQTTYSIWRTFDASKQRVNADGTIFYATKFTIESGNSVYNIPDEMFITPQGSAPTDIWAGSCAAFNTDTDEGYFYCFSKNDKRDYTMTGYVYKLTPAGIEKYTTFTGKNWGWLSYFTYEADGLMLNAFSYGGYYALTAKQSDGWTMKQQGSINPDAFTEKRNQHETIFFYGKPAEAKGQTIRVQQYLNYSNYGGSISTPGYPGSQFDFNEAAEQLGISDIAQAQCYIVNPDGSQGTTPSKLGYLYYDAQGKACSEKEYAVMLKYNNGTMYLFQDADLLMVGSTYTMRFGATYGGKTVLFQLNLEIVPDDTKFYGWGGCPDDNHPHRINLGIGIEWSCCNLDAPCPTGIGEYYAWGETRPKSEFLFENYAFYSQISYRDTGGDTYDIEGISSKYNTEREKGPVDNLLVLQPEDDAAYQRHGRVGEWRMPTDEECSRLLSVPHSLAMSHGALGYQFRTESGLIFIPFGGYKSNKGHFARGERALCWASTFPHDSSFEGDSFRLTTDKAEVEDFLRYQGFNIRPVYNGYSPQAPKRSRESVSKEILPELEPTLSEDVCEMPDMLIKAKKRNAVIHEPARMLRRADAELQRKAASQH